MRFLYGDSSPFPLGYDFLATLEAFMAASTRIVQLEFEAAEVAKQRDELAQNRVKGLEALEQFHNVVMGAVQDTAQKVRHQHALQYARAVAEYATQFIEEHRRSTLASNDRESLQLRTDGDRRAAEMRAHLEAFLKVARLPAVRTKRSIRLNSEGRDARYVGTVASEHPDGIATAFTIAPQRGAALSGPRRVSDFIQGVELRVGVEKSWLRGTVSPKQLNVDDWTITQVDMTDDSFDLMLRRKLAEKEAVGFQIRRSETGELVGTVEHPGVPASEALPGSLGPQDLAQVERLWLALRTATRDVADQKEQLLQVSLDGQPVFENALAVPLVVRLVSMFAPTVREIAKRSPNEFELTLKVEADGGRREELYLRKEALVSTLQPLRAKGRQVFAPLGLDSWVPSMTSAPPPVAASAPPPVAASAPPPVTASAPPPVTASAPPPVTASAPPPVRIDVVEEDESVPLPKL